MTNACGSTSHLREGEQYNSTVQEVAGMKLKIGSAPDSWGVWFPDDPHQTP